MSKCCGVTYLSWDRDDSGQFMCDDIPGCGWAVSWPEGGIDQAQFAKAHAEHLRFAEVACICPDEEGVTPADGCPIHDPVTVVRTVPAPEDDDLDGE